MNEYERNPWEQPEKPADPPANRFNAMEDLPELTPSEEPAQIPQPAYEEQPDYTEPPSYPGIYREPIYEQPVYTEPVSEEPPAPTPAKGTMVIEETSLVDRSSYSTGPIPPPKKRKGWVVALLVIGIVIGGLATTFGLYKLGLLPDVVQDISGNSPAFRNDSEDVTVATSGDPVPVPTGSNDLDVELNTIPTEPDSESGTPSTALTLQQVYEKTIDSVVSIVCDSGSGTGVVLSADGYIITNCHVVNGASTVRVILTDGRELAARVIGKDEISDLAVVYVNATDLVPAQFGNSDQVRVGDEVVAIGDPLGVELRGTMTNGIISAVNRNIIIDGRSMNVLQTNAALNPGNSGGPLINVYGQVIGINTMKIGDSVSTAGVEGLGFAIPSTTVKNIVDQLLTNGYIAGRPTLGIEVIDLTFWESFTKPAGAVVSSVAAGSDAEKKGITVGDIILQFDDTRITCVSDLNNVMANSSPNQVVKLTIYRNGSQYNVDIVLTEAKN